MAPVSQHPQSVTHRHAALASFAIVIAQISINIGAALGKGLFSKVGPEGVAALRTSVSAVLLLCIVRPWRFAPTRSQAMSLTFYGLALGGMNLLIYWSIQRIPIGIAVAIEICGPLTLVLLTSRSLKDLFWLSLAITGLLLLVPWPGVDARLDPYGIIFALGAAVCWALYIVFGKRASEVKGSVAVTIGMTIACLLTVPLGISAAGEKLLQGPVLALGAAVAILSNAFPYFIEMKALEQISTRVFGVITSCAPAVAAVGGWVILGERLTNTQWIAVMLMIVASAGCSIASTPAAKGEGNATKD
jgi:inner membrane transporter RhtA